MQRRRTRARASLPYLNDPEWIEITEEIRVKEQESKKWWAWRYRFMGRSVVPKLSELYHSTLAIGERGERFVMAKNGLSSRKEAEPIIRANPELLRHFEKVGEIMEVASELIWRIRRRIIINYLQLFGGASKTRKHRALVILSSALNYGIIALLAKA
ncbi:hypothetical protein HELRODRAFT_175678 [Helobdella robusta]|uniref:Uncharacterized protein n=1 Tax=Helobdella robusta TaxID=6412 RepID=T1F9I6_HELRO|nr:hypothetical protein HELRODRAFT_175678 [Helobdella robusta]ESO00693.1 hypothetical protein HELRODRAFT_175678 [Helobdella robusta]